MPIDEELLAILCCPETKQPLREADAELLEKINQRIAAGTLVNRGGETVEEPIDGGLVREDGEILYPVRDEIPEMLIDCGIELAKLAGDD